MKYYWVYDKWFELVEKLSSVNSYQRNIGIIMLANLCKSDKENRIAGILDDYLRFFNDEKFITSRQCLQNVWKIAIVHEVNIAKIIHHLKNSYYENIHISKFGKLIKQDIISSLFAIYQNTNIKSLFEEINTLIESETDEKLKKVLKKIQS